MKTILVIGGAGYVGSSLVPELLKRNYNVIVYDLMIYGKKVLKEDNKLKKITGDIRDIENLKKYVKISDYIIHLACISNDPSFELNPTLGKSINYDCFEPLVKFAKNIGVKRFIYASSSSVYGIKSELTVNEKMSLEPLTDYSKYKAMCEDILLKYSNKNFNVTILRPATVCGYSPRQRLDVIVNILTNHAYNKKLIKIIGGNQKRPNIHVSDMVNAYIHIIETPINLVSEKIFNVGFENYTVEELALIVQKVVGKDVKMEKIKTDDNRSYHIDSSKIKDEIKFLPQHNIEEAIIGLVAAFKDKLLKNPLNNPEYFNIKKMQEINLK
jgi:nucleoside-diphosphate-sugar epimerase